MSHYSDSGPDETSNVLPWPGSQATPPTTQVHEKSPLAALLQRLAHDNICVYDSMILSQILQVDATALEDAIRIAIQHGILRRLYVDSEPHLALVRRHIHPNHDVSSHLLNTPVSPIDDPFEAPSDIIFETQLPDPEPRSSPAKAQPMPPPPPPPPALAPLDPDFEQRRFELTVLIDNLYEKVLLMRVTVVLETIAILMMLRQLWLGRM